MAAGRLIVTPGPAASGPGLVYSSLWSFSGNLVYAASQWGQVIALSKLGEPGLLGRYALALAVAGPPMILANLQLRALAVTGAAGSGFRDYWKLRIRATAAALAAVAVLACCAGLRGEAWIDAALVALLKAAENVADLFYGVLQRHERLAVVAVLSSGKAVLSLGCFAAALGWSGRLWPALASAFLCHMLMVALAERPAARALIRRHRQDWEKSASGVRMAPMALRLGLVAVCVSLHAAIPRYFIAWRQGPAQLGYFAALSCFPMALQTSLGAVAQASMARMAACCRRDLSAFASLTARLAVSAAAVGCAAALACRWALPIAARLYRPDYAQQSQLLLWLMAAGAAAGVSGMLGTALTAAHIINTQVWLYALAMGITAAYCWFFVAPGRPAAGAQALAAGAAVLAAGQTVLLRRALDQRRRPV
jgi:hypothetical protein